jgi:serine/threonine-protein kinase
MAGRRVGGYTLEARIGGRETGGVWRARRADPRVDEVLAIKLLDASLVSHAAEDRFRQEAIRLARLHHPNITDLLNAGISASGQPYLVVEYVDGEHIDRWCDARRLGINGRVRLFLDVLSAVAHAHSNLIVHRAIEPSNVLVTRDGRVKLLNFGVAALWQVDGGGEPPVLTREGNQHATSDYAAPEQLTGGLVTAAADIYSLGVLLYVLLCGCHPSRADVPSPPGDPLPEIERRARPRGPDAVPRALRGDLEPIVGKALEKQPDDRYASVTAFAEDLQRLLDHLPIRAPGGSSNAIRQSMSSTTPAP